LGDDEVVVMTLGSLYSMMFGAQNDEALHGHPLYQRGLAA
jgi:hypothetical protein